MDYFNIFRNFKHIFSSFNKTLKYITIILFFLLLFIILFCFKGSTVKAVTDTVLSAGIEYFENSNYNSYFILSSNELILYDNVEGNRFYMDNNWLRCTSEDHINTLLFNISESGQVNYNTNLIKFGKGNYKYDIHGKTIVSGNADVYNNNDFTTKYFTNNYDVIEYPFLTENSIKFLKDNTFSSLAFYPSSDFPFFEVAIISKTTDAFRSYTFDLNSPYYTALDTVNYCFDLPRSELEKYFTFDNGNEFEFYFYDLNANLLYSSTYTIGANSVNENISITADSTSEIKNFLTNDSYDQSIVSDNLPNNSQFIGADPTKNGFSNLFYSIYHAFIDEYPQNVVFPIPFTNNTIVIPYDLTQNFLPVEIKNIIEGFWFFWFSLIIVKDIARYIDALRDGSIFDMPQEDIQTSML